LELAIVVLPRPDRPIDADAPWPGWAWTKHSSVAATTTPPRFAVTKWERKPGLGTNGGRQCRTSSR